MPRAFVLLLLLAACAGGDSAIDDSPITPTGPAEQYGFVARLGRDTVSVERISRTANALISDDVDRFPLVRQRHTALEIAPDGRLSRMVMEVRMPSGKTPAERWRKVRARFTNDPVMITIQDSSGITGRSFATEGHSRCRMSPCSTA